VDTGMILLESEGNDGQPYKIMKKLNMQDRNGTDDMRDVSDNEEQYVAENQLEDGEGYDECAGTPEREKCTKSILISSVMARHEDRMERVARRMKLANELNLKLRSEQKHRLISQFRTPTRHTSGQMKKRTNEKQVHDEMEANVSSSITRKTGHHKRKRKSCHSKIAKLDFDDNIHEDGCQKFDFFRDENSLDQSYSLENNDLSSPHVHVGTKRSNLHRTKILHRLKLAQKLIEKLRERRMSITQSP